MTRFTETLGLTPKELMIIGDALIIGNNHGDDVPYLAFEHTAIVSCFKGIQFEEFDTPEEIEKFYGEGFYDKWAENLFKASPEDRAKANERLSEEVYIRMESGKESPSHEGIHGVAKEILEEFPNSNLIIVPHPSDWEYEGTLWFV